MGVQIGHMDKQQCFDHCQILVVCKHLYFDTAFAIWHQQVELATLQTPAAAGRENRACLVKKFKCPRRYGFKKQNRGPRGVGSQLRVCAASRVL